VLLYASDVALTASFLHAPVMIPTHYSTFPTLPIYSAIVGTKAFIARCRWFKKAFGGGIRQAGILSAQADHALTHHFPRLAGTHALARKLATELEGLGCKILAPVQTNMVRAFSHSPILPFPSSHILTLRSSSRPNPSVSSSKRSWPA
jgi:hypothetical protein